MKTLQPITEKKLPGRPKGDPWAGCTKPREEVEQLVAKNTGLVYYCMRILLRKFPKADEAEATEAGFEALWRAAVRFRPELGWKFSTFASRCIFNRIKQRILIEGKRVRCIRAKSLDTTFHFKKGPSVLASVMAEEERHVMIKWVQEAMSQLEPRHAQIIHARVIEEVTLQVVADRLGITRERVRQIEKEAFNFLLLQLRLLREREARKSR